MSVRRRSIVYSGALPVLTYEGPATGIQNLPGARTHTGCGFGTPSPTRRILAVIGYSNGTGGAITSCTIGGVSATLAAQQVFTSGTGAKTIVEIWVASVPTGTSGSVVISGPSGNWTSGVSTYSVTDLLSATPADANGANNFASFSLAVPANGVVVAVAVDFASVSSHAWVGLTEDFGTVIASGNSTLSGASKTQTTAATLSISCTFNVGASPCVAASFR